jgi:aryl-alcohol dehydrogenase-like predicted oxidoreductase/enamine deaminase RidA (YjgF/YER057c/UK114 family)
VALGSLPSEVSCPVSSERRVPTSQLAPGLSVSRIITGLWQVADLERGGRPLDPEVGATAMAAYADAGLTSFDMADHYGSAESIAGHFRAGRDASRPVQLLTKWVPSPGPLSRDEVRAAVDRARQRLGVERLDLLQFHTWWYADPSWIDALFWLDELRQEGLIGELGLTNVDTAHLRVVLASGIRVVTNQVACSLLDRRFEGPMQQLCLATGTRLLGYGAVAGGLLTERWVGRPEPAAAELVTWSQMKYARFVRAAGGWERFQSLLRALQQVAERLGVSMANVAIRYVLESPAVAGVIVGARLGVSAHIDDTLRVFDVALDDAARATLAPVLATLTPIPGDCGDEYRKPPFLTASGDLSHHVADFPAPYPTTAGPLPDRVQVRSGTEWEGLAGYCRAVRHGARVLVSGTTATFGERLVGGSDPAAQTHAVIDKLEGALASLGARLEHVVRTRIYVSDLAHWEACARAHGERFRDIRPANTMVEARLIGAGYLVEIEAEALVDA